MSGLFGQESLPLMPGMVGYTPWYMASSYKSGNIPPTLLLDFVNQQYASAYREVSFSDLFTFTRASTGTYVDDNGLVQAAAIDTPRFTYDEEGNNLGILIEEQRTNLLTKSVPQTGWGGFSYAFEYDTLEVADPTGGNNAMVAAATAAEASHFVTSSITSFNSGTTYTFSVFIRPGTAERCQLSGASGAFGTSQYANFNLTNDGSVLASTGGVASITKINANWYRLSWTIAASITASVAGFVVSFINSDTATRNPSYLGADESLYIWGGQVEATALFPTSYIPTAGASATRAADSLSITGTDFSEWYNQTEGTFYVDFNHIENTVDTNAVLAASNGTYTNMIAIMQEISGTNYRGRFHSGGSEYHSTWAGGAGDQMKFALAYKANDNAFYRDGSSTTISSQMPSAPTGIDRLGIGSDQAGSGRYLNGTIKELRYYPVRVINSELERITT